MTRYQQQLRRSSLLKKYRLILINKGIPELIANKAFGIWDRGVRNDADSNILDQVNKLLDRKTAECGVSRQTIKIPQRLVGRRAS